MQLVLERLVARLEGEDSCGLLAKLDLEAIDGVALLPQLGELARGLGLQLLHADLKPARGHRELGAQLILVSLDLGHGQRSCRLEPPHGEPNGARMHEGYDHQGKQAGGKKAEPDVHHRLDHEITPPPRTRPNATTCHAGAPSSSLPTD